MDNATTAHVELEQHLEDLATSIAPQCATCPEFLPSEHTPSVGICMLWACQVLRQDKACSQWYQEPEAGTGEADEF